MLESERKTGRPGSTPSARSKIARTRARVLEAFEELLREIPAADVTFTAVCARAGVSTDVVYAAHHRDLREAIERRRAEQVKAQSEAPGARRRRLPVSMTAAEKIARLEEELAAVKADYGAAIQALNVLSQVVDALTGEGEAGTPRPPVLLSPADSGASPTQGWKRHPPRP